jgi:hypothetical protein
MCLLEELAGGAGSWNKLNNGGDIARSQTMSVLFIQCSKTNYFHISSFQQYSMLTCSF